MLIYKIKLTRTGSNRNGTNHIQYSVTIQSKHLTQRVIKNLESEDLLELQVLELRAALRQMKRWKDSCRKPTEMLKLEGRRNNQTAQTKEGFPIHGKMQKILFC